MAYCICHCSHPIRSWVTRNCAALYMSVLVTVHGYIAKMVGTCMSQPVLDSSRHASWSQSLLYRKQFICSM